MTSLEDDPSLAALVRLRSELARTERRLDRERAARRDSERIAEDSLRRLYEANELKTVLLGTVNHELRTPVTVIVGFVEQVLRHWDELPDDQRRTMVERVAANALSLQAMVEQVLELASLEVDVVQRDAVDLHLPTWLPGVLAEFGTESEPARVFLAEPTDDVTVRVGEAALRQVVVRLVDNALRYSPDGSRVHVEVAAEADGAVVLSVVDRGPGVPDELRARIFEPFYRGPGDHVTRTSGLGLGLAVVRRVAGLLGADVDVSDEPDGGSRFRLRFADVT